MLLAKLIIGKRGRVTLPRHFMLANDIKPGDNLEVFSVEERERTL